MTQHFWRMMSVAIAAIVTACGPPPTETAQALQAAADPAETATVIEPIRYQYEIVGTYPHDPQAFTQGLFYEGDGRLLESTGRYGESSVRRVALDTGTVRDIRPLPNRVFGEGLAPIDNKLFVLTWRSEVGFILDRSSFEPIGTFAYTGEGWGLTSDGARLFLSDGTSSLRILDPETLAQTGRLTVTYRGEPLPLLNELEWIDGRLWANVWQTDTIVEIDPETGIVIGQLDLPALYPADRRQAPLDDVLNGIAYDPETGHLFVTGKLWPSLFELKLLRD
ncbi:MAG: glutaminyl-peptide cyclotransferase [Pseudomonadota bacterium]